MEIHLKNFFDAGVSKHEDIVKKFRSRRCSRQIDDSKIQTNGDLDLSVEPSDVLSNEEFSNNSDSKVLNNLNLNGIREEEEISSPIHLDLETSINTIDAIDS